VSQGVVLRMENELATIARKVNAAGAGWTAATPKRFGTLKEAKALCGTWLADHPDYVALPEKNETVLSAMALPTDFDSRTQWSKCTVISKVRDQSSCGSCWAFGSTETFEDRRCIATGEDVEFSTEDTAGCCKGLLCGLSMGCNGGQPGAALSWMSRTGVVTGGDYTDIGTGSGCKPYTLAPCAHHVDPTPKYPACPSSEYPTPQCSKSCSEKSYAKDYDSDKTKASKAYSISGETNIMNSILAKGPVSAAFTVYSDFPTYKTGVYRHTSGSQLGGHAVEIVGWGVDSGTKYWLVKNSWNEQWGDGGFFKILRGSNECGIEGQINGVDF